MNTIYRNARHLLMLANDIIDLVRVAMRHLSLAREPVGLGAIIDEACEIVRRYVEAKGLHLNSDAATDLPTLHVNRLRVRQVLLNLLTNAARFTEQGGIRISVTRDVSEARVAVSDTGSGITPDDLAPLRRVLSWAAGSCRGGVGAGWRGHIRMLLTAGLVVARALELCTQ